MKIKIFHCYQSTLILPQHLEKMNLYIYSKPLLFRQRVSFETLFEIPDVMNLSNSDCTARYNVTNADGTIDYNPLEAHTIGTALPDFSSKIKVSPPASSTKFSPHKNIPLTVAQHFSALRRTLSCMYKNILLTAAQDFMAQYRLFCKHTTHKNTIELFSNIETCFTIFLPFVVHSPRLSKN